jgi:hypothetical protein
MDPFRPAVRSPAAFFRRRPDLIRGGFGIGRRLLRPHGCVEGRYHEENGGDQNAEMEWHGDVTRCVRACRLPPMDRPPFLRRISEN